MLTAATPLSPWADSSGNPSSSLAGFAKVLDYIAIMNYDVWGPWAASVGPNAPLRDSCAPADAQIGSAENAVQAWSNAGIPKSQIILGTAGYGHSYRVKPSDAFVNGTIGGELALYAPFNASDEPVGDKWDDAAGIDECGNFEGQGGLFDFWGLVDAGFLTAQGNPAQGIGYRYDTCTQTVHTLVVSSFPIANIFAAANCL
jgi:chitinase